MKFRVGDRRGALRSRLAVSVAVNASGAVRISTVPLITPEEMDAAVKTSLQYRAPGA